MSGEIYRLKMKVGHRFGWCKPEPTLVDPEYVWCHWCGMRGHRTIIDEVRVAEAMAQKQSEPYVETGES